MKATTSIVGEYAGVVTSVGSELESHFRPGDRVCAWNGTPFASQARVTSNTYGIPAWMTFAVGASVLMVFATAYYALVEVANL